MIPIAPYIAFDTVDVVRISSTPESSTALGNTGPLTLLPRAIGCGMPFTYTVMARKLAFQKSTPVLSLTSPAYWIFEESETIAAG